MSLLFRQVQCKTAIARLTGLGGEDLLIACTMLDPSGSGLVSIDSIVDFLTDELYVPAHCALLCRVIPLPYLRF